MLKMKSMQLGVKSKDITKTLLMSKAKPTVVRKVYQKKTEQLEEYKQLLDRVTNKIDIWHRELHQEKRGKFQNDGDFIGLQPSPTKFQSDWSSVSDDSISKESLSKDSVHCRSPKLSKYEKLDTSNCINSSHRIRVIK